MTTLTIREMERAYQKGDPAYNGLFILGVRTTGIFCRPNCPARKPLPKNVEFFATSRDALVAGYRPCKRCRPMMVDAAPPWVLDLLSAVEKQPEARIRESDLRGRGVHPATVRRYFQQNYGMTFQAYARARRLGRALHQIRRGTDMDQVVYENGYESASGFRDAFVRTFGTTPGRSGDPNCVTVSWVRSPLGPLLAGATSDGICLLEFTDRRMIEAQITILRRLFQAAIVPGTSEHLEKLEAELGAYFAGKLTNFTVPLLYPGTGFQRSVWRALLDIPYGETRSYEDIAVAVGRPTGPRAVGRANGLNRIAIVIPCHRVVNKDGQLGGYGGGLRRKQFLLDLERGVGTAAYES